MTMLPIHGSECHGGTLPEHGFKHVMVIEFDDLESDLEIALINVYRREPRRFVFDQEMTDAAREVFFAEFEET